MGGLNLFGNYNMFAHKRAKECIPTYEDICFLEELANLSRRSKVTSEQESKLEELEERLAEINDYNESLDDVKDNDYRFIELSKEFQKAYRDAKEALGIIYAGGVTAYKKERIKEGLINSPLVPSGYSWESEYMCYFPEDYDKKLDPKGNWIFILDDYAIVDAPPRYTIHYATPVTKPSKPFGVNAKLWYAGISFKGKEILFNPYEYTVIRDANWLLEMVDKEIEMVEGSSTARLDKNKVFYLKSRGFNQAEIYKILFKSVTNKGFCYFRTMDKVSNIFDRIKAGFNPVLAEKIENHFDNIPNVKFKSHA